ncbi:acetyl-CoA carboxylase, biotin carboxyl carrier protein [Planosporangium thailandense]|uniref:Biotin carboxyl carrier protein of acetyl-CoA carboxylase n=1 Tax=Planosporangium thailandense TaxID=765197 RepID=A0ABX0XXB1_9ACTN|nr:biotin/lipoyl-containing protein [Planosporangium thailandense]NJC69927.1 acetyl-CoA carboxylase, biotin carboxyl carrier protein [Planosporangium thailandense]
MTENAGNLAEVLDVLHHSVGRMLSLSPTTPTNLRVTAGDVGVELTWQHGVVAGVNLAADPGDPTNGHSEPVSAEDDARSYVSAPTVGVFYHAPEPGAPPLVQVGQSVDSGQQVGIVEAMKTMIPVIADRVGTVAEVLVPDATSVEYGQRLLAITPLGDD